MSGEAALPHRAARQRRSSIRGEAELDVSDLMRVRFCDPQGPRWLKLAAILPSVVLWTLAAFGPWIAAPASYLACVGAALTLPALLFMPHQGRPRPADVVCGPGFIRVNGAGTRSQRIRARDIAGCSTARGPDGIVLTIEHVRRDHPITIEVETEAEADEIRRSLGIGHDGFGMIGWSTLMGPTQKTGVAAAVFVAFTALARFTGPGAWMFSTIAVAFAFFAIFARAGVRTIAMRPDGLQIFTPRGWAMVPYAHLLGVEIIKRGMLFRTVAGTLPVETPGFLPGWSLGEHTKATLALQVESAAARARGDARARPPFSDRIGGLRRGGEAARSWLARLDATGQVLGQAGGGGGYRDTSLDTEDLWTLLEDPDADPELRAAAARVLRHLDLPEARVRIDAAVAATRIEGTTKRLRIALQDDVDKASHDLERLETDENLERAKRMVL